MKNCIRALAVLVVFIIPGVAKAQNAVTIVTAEPSAGQVQVAGTYNIGSGYTLSSITVQIQPTGGTGGQGGQGVATTDGMGNFTATISVPAGTYDVQAYLTVKDSSNNLYYIFSNTMMGIPVPPS